MENQDRELFKWYSPFVLLVGTILSFADPITDILTLVEFYRADHKTWFGVGLAFVILPCLGYLVLRFLYGGGLGEFTVGVGVREKATACTGVFLCSFHPFSAALSNLQAFVFCLSHCKKLWRGIKLDIAITLAGHILMRFNDVAIIIEAVLESTPQFIIQLYVMNIQEEPVKVIQMISLLVSFLSLVEAFITIDEVVHTEAIIRVKNQIVFLITHLLLLSSRLFAIGFFIVSYKWWIIGVLSFHSISILLMDAIVIYRSGECMLFTGIGSVLLTFAHWLRDDMSVTALSGLLIWPQLVSNILFVVENFVMILLFYFSQDSNTWYSLPVTVCVCLFAVLGAVLRVVHFNFFLVYMESMSTITIEYF